MMEFYSESENKARKEYTCELCKKTIRQGERYFRETGKFNGCFFDRALHTQCHLMEADYCYNVDCEFTWDDITEYIIDEYCSRCECREADDCQFLVTECPKILNFLTRKGLT